MPASSNRAVTPVVVGLLLVVLMVAAAILGYVFLLGAEQGFKTNTTGITAVIMPALYSRDAKVGVLGDTANFTITLSNTLSSPQRGQVQVINEGRAWQSIGFVLLASRTSTFSVSQVLNATGIWVVKVTTASGIDVDSYFFQVMKTTDEADFAISQWHDQNFYRNLLYGSFMIAILSLILSAASLARRPKTVIQASS